MREFGIVTVTSADKESWLAVVQKDKRMYHVFRLGLGVVGGLHKSMLYDAVLIFSSSEARLHEVVKAAYPESVEGEKEVRR